MQIEPYGSGYETLWNAFVERSKNGTFLFDRRYMDYHADRFTDCSLLFFEKGVPVALLPANISGDTVCSHGGLTYGGVIADKSLTVRQLTDVFQTAAAYYRDTLHARHLCYKPVPYIYHTYPAQEDLYALFRMDARLVGRGLSSAIALRQPIGLATLRRRRVNKALRTGVTVGEATCKEDWETFWKILTAVLAQRHSAVPVHTSTEILLLHSRFPDCIRLMVARCNGHIVAGCVLYVCATTVHVQYIAAGEEGRAVGALDLLFARLIEADICRDKSYLDFGISTEDDGHRLNEGLIFQKEGFGARGVCYDRYIVEI